jgi:hypothetical protein
MLSSGGGSVVQELQQDLLQYTFVGVAPGYSYSASVRYENEFGEGPSVSTGFITPTQVPDAPVLVSVSDDDQQSLLVWQAPAYQGQSPISDYYIYRDGNLITIVNAGVLSYTATGLLNGSTYSFSVKAVNAVGQSATSDPVHAQPYGAMTVDSIVANGKVLTATISPNGRPIQSFMFVAIDNDPSDLADGDFIASFSQGQINQARSGTIQVIKNFSSFSSAIDFYVGICHNESNSAFLKSA